MGEVLAGSNAVWELAADAVVIRYSRGVRGSRLLQALGEKRVPYEALRDVELAEGRRGTVVLRAVPRPGADPLIEVADGQLRPSADPYRLVLPEHNRRLAENVREVLLAALGGTRETDGPSRPSGLSEPGGSAGLSAPTWGAGPLREDTAEPPPHFLVPAPPVPRSFKAYDAKAAFDGRTVGFRWFRTGASTAKWRAGDQNFPVEELSGVEWHSPEREHGHLRLLPRDPSGPPAPADQDPAAVVFGLGYGPVHESLPFAAAVLSAIRSARTRP